MMSTRRFLVAFLLALPFALGSCKVNTINYFPPKPANVRAANFVVDVPTLDFTANSAPLASGVAFGNSSLYQQVSNEPTTFAAFVPGASQPLVSALYNNISGEAYYTILTYGARDSGTFLAIPDTPTQPAGGNFAVRMVNIAAQTSGIDVYFIGVTDTVDQIVGMTPAIQNTVYGGASQFKQFPAGGFRILIVPTGFKFPILYDSGPISVGEGNNYDLVAYTTGSVRYLGLTALPVTGGGGSIQFPSTLANLKAVNEAPGQTVNLLLDGSPIATSIPYLGTTSTTYQSGFPGNTVTTTTYYLPVAPGPHTVAFESASTPGSILGSVTAEFPQASDRSVYLAGNAGATSAHLLVDLNLRTTATRVRWINASPDAPALQILVGDTVVVPSLGTYMASDYVTTAPASVTVTLKDAATGAVLQSGTLDLSASTGLTTSVYISGPTTSLYLNPTADK